MPDISMCKNKDCPKRKDCYRFTAKPDEFAQSYGNFKWKKGEGCDYFWDIKK